ncbi:hypothetical protein LCGC14_0480870 [marine sediment metagenome]|uniref:Uncharacterized protein n=1 Tax=marine sediment metagenome TaxID=412755 RepID=A0A0F9VI29_9ZZZZ
MDQKQARNKRPLGKLLFITGVGLLLVLLLSRAEAIILAIKKAAEAADTVAAVVVLACVLIFIGAVLTYGGDEGIS